MKIECVCTVLKSLIIEVDDKYKKLLTDDYTDELLDEFVDKVHDLAPTGTPKDDDYDFCEVHGAFDVESDQCIYED